MEFLLIIFAIVSLISNANKKKKKAEEERRRQASAEWAAELQRPAREDRPAPDPRFPEFVPMEGEQTAMDDPRFPGFPPPKTPGEGDRSIPNYAETAEARAAREAREARKRRLEEERRKRAAAKAAPIAPRVAEHARERKLENSAKHVVAPSREIGHTHMESSMAGFAACPAPAMAPRVAAAPLEEPATRPVRAPYLAFDVPSVTAGLIYAEILGKPKALRR